MVVRIACLLVGVLFAFAAAACNGVYTSGPVGRNPVPLSPQEWEGLWIMEMHGADISGDAAPVVIKILDEKMGVLQAWGMDKGEGKYVVSPMLVFIRSSGDTHFISFPSERDSDIYLWAVFGKSAGRMVLYLPSPNQFHAYVDNGSLPGDIDGTGDVWLWAMSDEQLELIGRSEALFLKDPIVVLTRWESKGRPAVLPPVFKEEIKRAGEAPAPITPPDEGDGR